MATNPNVLGIFGDPDRESCLNAIRCALLRVRADTNASCERIGKLLDCSADTIENACKQNNGSLLSFDSIAKLVYHFPEASAPILHLWELRPAERPTTVDRIERIERELAAIRKEVG